MLLGRISFLFVIPALFFLDGYADAGNFNMSVHTGYGVIKIKENENYLGDKFESKYINKTVLFGASGEYSFQRFENFYVGITTDWVFGLKDEETWKKNNVQIPTNNLKIFGQLYDLRFGYKNIHDNLHYKLYLSGGWDGLRLKREKWRSSTDTIYEDFSLWRTGGGIGVGYKLGKWTLDGKVAYFYYVDGEVEDSTLPQFTFDANGTLLDVNLGFTREIAKDMSFYAGGRYTLQRLEGDTTSTDISWKTRLEILAGMINLRYMF